MSTPGGYPSVHMISWQRYGYRMIGAADRFALARARTMGQTLDLSSSQYHRAGSSVMTGEGTTYTPPPPPPPPPPAPVHKVIRLALGTQSRPAPPVPPPMQPPPAHITMTAPIRTLAQANPVCPQCDCPSPVLYAGGGALAAGLLMYVVGLATREKKKRGRR